MEPPPTLEELVKKVRISPKILEQKCSDNHLKSISLFLGWRTVAPHLGLSKMDIEAIEFEKRTEGERRLEVLQKWKMKYGFKATFNSLIAALLAIENAEDAERVCALLHTPADADDCPTSPAENFPVDKPQSTLATVAEPTKQLLVSAVEVSDSPVNPLECNIEKEIEELEDQFFDVVVKAASCLEGVPLAKLKMCVTQLPVSVKYQHKKFLEDKLSAIDNAPTVAAVFAILGLYWNFLNCGLLTELIRRLGNDETKLLMEQYTEQLRQFRRKTKLGDFVGKWAQSTPPHFVEFKAEMGHAWRDYTLEDLVEFRKRLARSLCVEEYALIIKSANSGSVVITWALPSSLPGIADTLQSAFLELQKHGVLRMIFQGKCIPDLAFLKSQTGAEHQVVGETKHTDEESPPLTTTRSAAPSLFSTPPEMSCQDTEQRFDMITTLLGAGVPHIVEQILQILDVKSLVMSEQVSRIWRDIIGDLCMWKHRIQHNIDSNTLWRDLFKRRGWNKYLDVPPAEQISRQFYRQLHHNACRDIHSLEANWRRGHYTLTRVETGSGVRCLQFDDIKIVTGHEDSTIEIWDRSTLRVLKVLKGHKSAVRCLQYDEKVVISGSSDHTVKVWDIQTGQVMNDLLHHKNYVRSLKFTADTVVTGSYDETVAVWKVVSPTDITLRMSLKGHEAYVLAVDLSETTIISGSRDNTIKVWDAFTGELVRTLRGHSGSVRCLQLQGSHLISGSSDGTIRIWNVDTRECVRELHGHGRSVLCVAVDNKRIVSGSLDKTIKVWDLAAALDTGSSSDTLCIATLEEHTDWVRAVQFDDFQIISGSDDGTLVVHDFLNTTPPILRT